MLSRRNPLQRGQIAPAQVLPVRQRMPRAHRDAERVGEEGFCCMRAEGANDHVDTRVQQGVQQLLVGAIDDAYPGLGKLTQ